MKKTEVMFLFLKKNPQNRLKLRFWKQKKGFRRNQEKMAIKKRKKIRRNKEIYSNNETLRQLLDIQK